MRTENSSAESFAVLGQFDLFCWGRGRPCQPRPTSSNLKPPAHALLSHQPLLTQHTFKDKIIKNFKMAKIGHEHSSKCGALSDCIECKLMEQTLELALT